MSSHHPEIASSGLLLQKRVVRGDCLSAEPVAKDHAAYKLAEDERTTRDEDAESVKFVANIFHAAASVSVVAVGGYGREHTCQSDKHKRERVLRACEMLLESCVFQFVAARLSP